MKKSLLFGLVFSVAVSGYAQTYKLQSLTSGTRNVSAEKWEFRDADRTPLDCRITISDSFISVHGNDTLAYRLVTKPERIPFKNVLYKKHVQTDWSTMSGGGALDWRGRKVLYVTDYEGKGDEYCLFIFYPNRL